MALPIDWLRNYVISCMEEGFGSTPNLDDDCEPAFRQGTAACFVQVVDLAFPLVRVWAVATTGLSESKKLLREINDVNSRAATAHVYLAGGAVIVEQTMHGEGVESETLRQAVFAVSGVANDIGELLAITFGGETPYPPEETEDADVHDDAA